MTVIIWHNPRCSKSRQGLALIEEQGIEPTIVRYLEEPPSAEELDRVLNLMGKAPRDLMRRKESIYKELGLDDDNLTRSQLIVAMSENPKLIERPVVINGRRAALGRPPEAILEIF
ncbi:MAG: arsenate reductase (glutaredoxin) [Acidobacteria bacterium]|nr:MAG: arsenate reductase (glutaredoxin) [Acidobacteriota bacterium]